MTHLYIELNTGLTEEVNSSIISKLYELAISGDLDETSDLKGRLHSTTGYVSQVNYLNTNFQDLIISCDNLYVEFLDPVVSSILSTNFGDGVGITLATVTSMTSFAVKFRNSNITSFNELSQFTNITEINYNNSFNNCTSLTSIDLSNITKISGKNGYERNNFEDCTSLTSIGNTSNLTYIGYCAFLGCPLRGVIDFSNVVLFSDSALYQYSNATTTSNLSQCTIDNSKITFIGHRAFSKCSTFSALSTINFPNLETYSQDGQFSKLEGSFEGCTQIQHVTNLGKITHFGNSFSEGCFSGCDNLLDVVFPETLTSIGYSAIGLLRSLRYVKILATTVPQYITIDGFNNKRQYGIAFGEYYNGSISPENYDGSTYPVYVRDDLLSLYQVADGWKYVGPNGNRLKPLSQFATDFPNG